ncbi:sensor histidine kinase [Micromonospora sagamiensis]|uniref:histidine kinase n=1 Tax=Micromonospora sagamiensis TaxID=47875 RepID=A0A562WCA6_9ACTN|nr:histidine kinase [Micromonospora sagamiensis]TWJ27836.1 histidine kinase [Micromonospora sagamiensis]BCL13275.1 two-component sensor histidine kinase [Micromonospora sagamiensis]
MMERLDAWGRRAGQAVALTGMALLGIVDVALGGVFVLSGDVGLLVALWHVALAVGAAAVWLPAHRQGSRLLPVAAAVLVAGSLATTIGRFVLTQDAGLLADGGPRGMSISWGLAESVGLLGVVFVVARWAAPGPALVLVAASGLAVSVLPMRVGTESALQVVGMGYALLAAGSAAAGMYFRMAATARGRQLDTVRAEQRAEFARDLHDFIAHHVTGIVVQAQGARYVAERDPQRAVAALEQIERAGAETMTAMRRMVGVLRGHDAAPDAPLAPLAGLAELPDLVENFAAAGPVEAHLHTEGHLDDLAVEVTSSAYRVVMEALTNVRQHATGARRVDVRVTRTPDWLLVRISDDGRGPRAGRTRERPGFGLVGLTERAGALGGRLSAGPGVDGGWVVDMALPLHGGRGR